MRENVCERKKPVKVREICWEKAPEAGYVLAYFRQKVLFQKFGSEIMEQILKLEQQDVLLELHVFDSEKEYRLIRCETGEFFEAVVSDENAGESKVESVQLEKGYEHLMPYLKVVNYIDYDENGMLYINNYRFAPAEGGK